MYGKGESMFSVEPIITSSRKPSYGEFNNTQKLRVQSGVGRLPIVHTLHSCGEGIPIFFFYSQRSGYCPWLNLIKRPLSEARSFWIFLSMELAFWYTSTIDSKNGTTGEIVQYLKWLPSIHEDLSSKHCLIKTKKKLSSDGKLETGGSMEFTGQPANSTNFQVSERPC